jgi:non-homologous end joining protein Ku
MFEKKVYYKLQEKDFIRLAPFKSDLFKWITLSYGSVYNLEKLNSIFDCISNIMFNTNDTFLLSHLIDDMEKYFLSEQYKLNYKNAVLKDINIHLHFEEKNHIDYLEQYIILENIITQLYRIPQSHLPKHLKKFEKYIKLRYNIINYDKFCHGKQIG